MLYIGYIDGMHVGRHLKHGISILKRMNVIECLKCYPDMYKILLMKVNIPAFKQPFVASLSSPLLYHSSKTVQLPSLFKPYWYCNSDSPL